jgi:O-antigen/teichoic acid export membrane protein
MLAARWSMRLLGLVSTLVLVRLLTPADFGLVAMVMLAYGLLETISYAGVDLALLKGDSGSREHFNTAWTIQILQGCFIAVLLLVSSPWVARYFNEPRILDLVFWLALRAVIDGFQNIGVVAFRRELDFAKEFRFTVYTKVGSVVVVIAVALWLRNYWALVIGSLFASVVGVAVSYVMHPYRPRLTLIKAPEIWSFSQGLLISRVGSFLNRKCDEFIVGGQAGSSAMGTYHVASDLATLPSSEVVMPVRRAMFPTLARLTQESDAFGRAVLNSFAAIAALCLFIGACLFAAAPELIAVVLGDKWLEAVPVFRWLAIFGTFSALVLVLEVPIWVSGRTGLSAIQSWVELAIVAPATWFALSRYGVEGAAIARATVGAAMVPFMIVLVSRLGAVAIAQFSSALWRPLTAAIVTGFAVHALPTWFDTALLSLCLKVAVSAAIFPVVQMAFWRAAGAPEGFERAVLDQFKGALGKGG